ncbi:MAG: TIGR03668 family PPOX class F420-dependent oxidoreductase [Proteobacteria bacterium]|nr:TIGR03668 family PPOX class F420-dependent oxidoreductase [Pseudomonadota bacterium]
MTILSQPERDFLDRGRVGHLGTADRQAAPHVMPVCYAVHEDTLYITVDRKPKRAGPPLKRLRNITENPRATVVVDRYDETWARLGWVVVGGAAELLFDGVEHDTAQAMLRERYPQYRTMEIADLPVIALRIAHSVSWGDLEE